MSQNSTVLTVSSSSDCTYACIISEGLQFLPKEMAKFLFPLNMIYYTTNLVYQPYSEVPIYHKYLEKLFSVLSLLLNWILNRISFDFMKVPKT